MLFAHCTLRWRGWVMGWSVFVAKQCIGRVNLSVLFSLSVCETSYEGHMVDALASRAEEGRSSLR